MSVCGLALLLVMMIGAFAGSGAPVRPTALGAFLLGPEAGGYVIVALIAFALGVAAALLAQRRRWTKQREEKKEA